MGREDGGGLHPRHDGRRSGRSTGRPVASSLLGGLSAMLWSPSRALAQTPGAIENSPVTPRSQYRYHPRQPLHGARREALGGTNASFVPQRRCVCTAGIAGGAGEDLVVSLERGPSRVGGGPGLRQGRGRRVRARVSVPHSPTYRTAVSAVMSQPGPSPIPIPAAAATPVPLPARQTSWRLGLGRRAQPTSAAGGARGGPGRGPAAVTRCRRQSAESSPGAAAAPRSGTRARARAHAGPPPVTPER